VGDNIRVPLRIGIFLVFPSERRFGRIERTHNRMTVASIPNDKNPRTARTARIFQRDNIPRVPGTVKVKIGPIDRFLPTRKRPVERKTPRKASRRYNVLTHDNPHVVVVVVVVV